MSRSPSWRDFDPPTGNKAKGKKGNWDTASSIQHFPHSHRSSISDLRSSISPLSLRGEVWFADSNFTRGPQTKMGLGWNQALHGDAIFDLRIWIPVAAEGTRRINRALMVIRRFIGVAGRCCTTHGLESGVDAALCHRAPKAEAEATAKFKGRRKTAKRSAHPASSAFPPDLPSPICDLRFPLCVSAPPRGGLAGGLQLHAGSADEDGAWVEPSPPPWRALRVLLLLSCFPNLIFPSDCEQAAPG